MSQNDFHFIHCKMLTNAISEKRKVVSINTVTVYKVGGATSVGIPFYMYIK